MSNDYGDTQGACEQAQVLGGIRSPAPADQARYRAEQEAALEAQEKQWAQERAAQAAQLQADRTSQRRAAALEAALRTNSHGGSARQVVSDAREFDAFLKGESSEVAQ